MWMSLCDCIESLTQRNVAWLDPLIDRHCSSDPLCDSQSFCVFFYTCVFYVCILCATVSISSTDLMFD